MNHVRAHRLPDPKVIQVSLSRLALIPQDRVQRLMRRFWHSLLQDQASKLERRKTKSKGSEKGSEMSLGGQDELRGRTVSSPPVRRTSSPSGWEHDPKRQRVSYNTSRPAERSARYERSPHITSNDSYSHLSHYASSVHTRPHFQYSGASAGCSRSHFI